MNQYKHLSIEEREKAMVMREQGKKDIEIAEALNRSRSTIGREWRRNIKKNGEYSANYAQKLSTCRKRHCGRKALLADPVLYSYVEERMYLRWTPEQIAGRAKLEGYPLSFSYNAIYRAVNKCIIPVKFRKLMRFRWQRKAKKGGDGRSQIADTVSIHERPHAANERKELGHWESDTVLGQRKTGCMGTHVERKTGYLMAFHLEHRRNELFAHKTQEVFSRLPDVLKKSFTVDNGTEFMNHKDIARATNMDMYFCDAYAPWQRGSNENTNGLLRQFFPKGTSFANMTDDDVQQAVVLINNRPRKRFGFKSPKEMLLHELELCCT